MKTINIAIDGPSGSGKSTAAKNLAESLGIEYIDTGAMYRAVAYKALRDGVPAEETAIGEMLADTDIDFSEGRVYLDGENISGGIRALEVSAAASEISKFNSCRSRLVELQRRIAAAKSVVMDGRDIGSNVLPDASYKFFITASIEKRAERRWKELQQKGEDATLEAVKEDLKQRDYNDTHRKLNPLIKTEDAVEIVTDDIGIEEVNELLRSYIKI